MTYNPTLEEEAAALDAQAAASAELSSDPVLPSDVSPDEAASEAPKEKLAGKYNSVEELEEAYKNLERKLGAPKEAAKADDSDASSDDAKVEAAVTSAGLDMEALNSEYAENGTLSEASFEALEKSGITRDVVEAFIAGREALIEKAAAEVYETVGGVDKYTSMVEWAHEGLTEAEIEEYNSAISSGNRSRTLMAVSWLKDKYLASGAASVEPSRVLSSTGKAGGGNSGGTYASMADAVKDMQSPEYKNNPAYRAKVEAKLARSAL